MWKPRPDTAQLIDACWQAVQSVPYAVTVRWVFYRLLQEGWVNEKKDYKRVLSYLSRARKEYYEGWRPWTLADDTRAAIVGGSGSRTGKDWLAIEAALISCTLDRWDGQPVLPCWR